MAKRAKINYVNNPDFLKALVDYQKACREAEDSGDEKPPIPKYIGECIWQISTKLASRPNFSGYPFRDEMIMDGVENSLRYMYNFDSTKTENPFAYFTQCIWYAFLRRIAKEKKEMYIKFASSKEMLTLNGTFSGDLEDMSISLNVEPDYINAFIEEYESKLDKSKKKSKAKKSS